MYIRDTEAQIYVWHITHSNNYFPDKNIQKEPKNGEKSKMRERLQLLKALNAK